jgi:hypothetical protein
MEPILATVLSPPGQQGHKQQWLEVLLFLLFTFDLVAAKNPKENFCRRFAHQTTVIDDKLYIDGGWVNYDDFQQTHKNYSSKPIQSGTHRKMTKEITEVSHKIPGWHTTTSITSSKGLASFGRISISL